LLGIEITMEKTKNHWGLLFILLFFLSCFFSYLLLREGLIINKERYSFNQQKIGTESTTLHYNYHKYKTPKMKMSQFKNRTNNLENSDELEIINNNTFNESQKSFIFHKVEKGETLWKIANLYNVTVEDLILINNITDPNLIFSGSVLKILRNS
jgi:LysM repeat protein